MTIVELIELIEYDFKQDLKGNMELGYKHDEAIEITKRDIIELYGLTQPYDNVTIEHLNAVASTH